MRGRLAANGDLAYQSAIPTLYGFKEGEGSMHSLVTIEVDGAAALMRPSGQTPPFWLDVGHPPDDTPAFELYVRQLGPGAGAAQRMVKRKRRSK